MLVSRPPKVPAHRKDGPLTLTPTQRTIIGLQLQRYYQQNCGGPTPERLQMLLEEFQRRTEKILEEKTDR